MGSESIKLSKEKILSMSSKEISAYLIEITQTPICKDKEYCNFLVTQMMKNKQTT
jgi:hypothetical protein